MKRTTITLPDAVADLVAREARRRETSVSAVVRQLILDGLTGSQKQPREIPWAAIFDDPGMAGAEIDDRLAERWVDDIDRDRG